MLQSLSRKDHTLSPTNPRYDQETFLRKLDFLPLLEYHSNCEKYPPFFGCFRARPACALQASLQDLTGPARICDVTNDVTHVHGFQGC